MHERKFHVQSASAIRGFENGTRVMGESLDGRKPIQTPIDRPSRLYRVAGIEEPRGSFRDGQGVHDGGNARRVNRAVREDCFANLRVFKQSKLAKLVDFDRHQSGQDESDGIRKPIGRFQRPGSWRNCCWERVVRRSAGDLQKV